MKTRIIITKNGPYLVSGDLPLDKQMIVPDRKGIPIRWKKEKQYPRQKNYTLCRCGQSKDKPYCDKTHIRIGFDGTETASREEYLQQAGKIKGPNLDLTDVEDLCAVARFCHRAGGTWQLTATSDNSKNRKTALQQAGNCPSGRLVTWDKKSGQPIEPKFKPSLSLVEDLPAKTSGPIWVKGKILIESANGIKYEKRNRVTLCRCGRSNNKPFCDGSHLTFGFNDGDKNLKK